MNKHENESMTDELLTRLHLAEETQDALLYGHRPVMFYDPGEAATLLPGTAMDILLVRDNRIVASSAKDERYAAGRLFYVRSPRQYAVLQRDCGQMAAAIQATRFLAFAHNRGIALGSGALQEDTDLLLVVMLHGNVKRIRRVLTHCFSDVVAWRDAETNEHGLRRADEEYYLGLRGVIRLLCDALRGCGSSVSITDRAQLMTLMHGRMAALLPLFSAIMPKDTDAELTEMPYLCCGTVNISHMIASLLCLMLGISACYQSCTLCMTADRESMYPHFALTQTKRYEGAVRLSDHEAIREALRLSLHAATLFECKAEGGGRWRIRFSPMRAQYAEMYTLRSEMPSLTNDDFPSSP